METKAFFDELGSSIAKTAQGISGKVGDLYENQKVQGKISSEERTIKKLMADLGRAIYEKIEAGEQIDPDLDEICGKIKEHLNKVEELKEEAAKKKEKVQRTCPVCDKPVEDGFTFCPFCGAELPAPEPAEEEESEEAPAEDAEE